MKWYTDRIEGGRAVLQKETGETAVLPVNVLPDGLREGCVLEETGGVFRLSPAALAERRRRLYAKGLRLRRKETERKGD